MLCRLAEARLANRRLTYVHLENLEEVKFPSAIYEERAARKDAISPSEICLSCVTLSWIGPLYL